MSFTSDCNLRDVFSKKILGACSPVYMQTHAQAHTQRLRRMHGYSLKSLRSREVVTSAALFTRLMPRCTQERVNQARGYTRRPEPASRSFPVPLGTGTRLRHAMAALTEIKAGRLLDTLVHSTNNRGLGRAKIFRASMRSAAAVCRELCVAKRRE